MTSGEDLRSQSNPINPVNVVLHRPIYPRNIGMCARALANLGFQRLILVAPQTELTHEAKQGAAHAQRILAETTVYPTLADFYAAEGEGLRLALSGKDARLKKSAWIEETLQQLVHDPAHPVQDNRLPVYLFFGAEDDGLSADEMSLCHHICRIPTYSEVSSLNLSHAVLLTSYLVRRALEQRVSPRGADSQGLAMQVSPQDQPQVPTLGAPVYFPHETVHRWLDLLGFDLSSPRVNIEKTLKRILLSQTPTADELRTVQALLHQTIRKLEASKDGAAK